MSATPLDPGWCAMHSTPSRLLSARSVPADGLTGLWRLTVKAQCLSACHQGTPTASGLVINQGWFEIDTSAKATRVVLRGLQCPCWKTLQLLLSSRVEPSNESPGKSMMGDRNSGCQKWKAQIQIDLEEDSPHKDKWQTATALNWLLMGMETQMYWLWQTLSLLFLFFNCTACVRNLPENQFHWCSCEVCVTPQCNYM